VEETAWGGGGYPRSGGRKPGGGAGGGTVGNAAPATSPTPVAGLCGCWWRLQNSDVTPEPADRREESDATARPRGVLPACVASQRHPVAPAVVCRPPYNIKTSDCTLDRQQTSPQDNACGIEGENTLILFLNNAVA
jgi:hypothetical protein